MTQKHIRLARTPEVEKALSLLKEKYSLLSEAEIIKVALSEIYSKVQSEIRDLPMVDEETEKMIGKGLEDYKNGRFTKIETDQELDTYLKSL